MAVVDFTYVDKACAGDMEMRAELITLFMGQLRSLEPELRSSLSKGDLQTLAREAHSVKSTVLSFGMLELASALKKIEIVCKRILISSEGDSLSQTQRELYIEQIEAQPSDLRKWTQENQTEKTISDLVDFCKLQSDSAIAELTRAGYSD